MNRSFAFVRPLAPLLCAVLGGLAASCDKPPHAPDPPPSVEASPLALVREAVRQLPDSTGRVSHFVPPAGPGGGTMGFEFRSGVRLRVLAANASVLAGVMLDSRDSLLWGEIRTRDSVVTLLPSGDEIHLTREGGAVRATFLSRATEPPSRIVVVADEAGATRLDESSTRFEPQLNLEYGGRVATTAMALRVRSEALRYGGELLDCRSTVEDVTQAINSFCEVFSLVTCRGPAGFALRAACDALNRALDEARDEGDPASRWVASLQRSVDALCAGAEEALEIMCRTLGPVGTFCDMTATGQQLFEILTGRDFADWLADQICGAECPPGTHRDARGDACVCDNRGEWNESAELCECRPFQRLDPATGMCECANGGTWNENSRTCDCPLLQEPFPDDGGAECLDCEQGAVRACELQAQAARLLPVVEDYARRYGDCVATPGCDSGALLAEYQEWYLRWLTLKSGAGTLYVMARVRECPNLDRFASCLGAHSPFEAMERLERQKGALRPPGVVTDR